VAFIAMDRLILVGLYRLVPNAKGADDHEARYRHPLASCRFQIVLALEIPETVAASRLFCWKFAG
jgi:hypothetical protein